MTVLFGLLGQRSAPSPAWDYTALAAKALFAFDPAVGLDVPGGTWTDAINGLVATAATQIDTDGAGLNGQPRVIADASDTSKTVLTFTTGIITATACRRFTVGRFLDDSTNALTNGPGLAGGDAWEPYLGNMYYEWFGASLRQGPFSSVPTSSGFIDFCIETRNDGAGNWSMRMNGSVIGSSTLVTASWGTAWKLLANSAQAAAPGSELDFDMVTVEDLTSDEETKMRAYITSRWGVAA